MKTEDYINTLINEKESLKATCKSQSETIMMIKKELGKLHNIISKKDKKISQLEQSGYNIKLEKEIESVKEELGKLKIEYNDLCHKYDEVVKENMEYKTIFDEIENICDSE